MVSRWILVRNELHLDLARLYQGDLCGCCLHIRIRDDYLIVARNQSPDALHVGQIGPTEGVGRYAALHCCLDGAVISTKATDVVSVVYLCGKGDAQSLG
jgi:hypothetical protein